MGLENVIFKLEKYLNDKIPADIIKILEFCAFENESSLMSIDNDAIVDIENYVNENPEILKETSYENVNKFKFKPGHRLLIIQLPQLIKNCNETETKLQKIGHLRPQMNFSQILKSFIETAESNNGKQPNGFRYDEINRYFSTFIYLLCGKACYDTLSANLPIPSSHTILRYINENNSTIIEGELRCKELKSYLEALKLPMVVWLSEDASSIISKIEYDQRTNQMIGIVLPTEPRTGMPVPFSFLARNVEEIQSNMKQNMSVSVYLVMAQPLAINVPPFIIQLFGTDNKFKTKDVALRWQHTQNELKRYGIDVAGFSGDGDARILKSMRNKRDVSVAETFKSTVCYFQDIVHIATRLRNRLLNVLICLSIGYKVASVSHLKMLLNSVPKDMHGLVYSDICPDDRQNFSSLRRIMHPRVREALIQIVDSDATIEYIRICDDITSSLYTDDLPPSDRLYLSWRATYFLRAWRIFITNTRDMTLENNFITPNAYGCIELNSQNLIILIRKFRDQNMDEYFLPSIFNSQSCEETFRKFRSLGTINYTKINFTLLELIHLVKRIEIMNDIMYFKLVDRDVIFPRDPAKNHKENKYKLPDDNEIENTLLRASSDATAAAKKFGINITFDEIADCKLRDVEIDCTTDDDNVNTKHTDLGIASDVSDILLCHRNLKDYPQHSQDGQNSSFVNITGESGSKTVRISSLMWNLSSSKDRISSDRVKRVRNPNRKSYRQLEFVDVTSMDKPLCVAEKIKIGDWCIFKNIYEKVFKTFLLGNIISFQYASESKTYKDRKYLWDFAPPSEDKKDPRKIEVLSSWYKVDVNGIIHTFDLPKCTFISMDHYVATLSYHVIVRNDTGKICVSQNNLKLIQNALNEINKTN